MSENIGTNWAGNIAYGATEIFFPTTVEQVQERVAKSPKVRALGSRHSFNRVADTDGALISLQNLEPTFALDRHARTVTVNAGVLYGELARTLHGEGYALHNLASLPHISVAGAVSTATHGSGSGNSSLASAVRGLELVAASGETRWIEGADLNGAVVSLGALGIVTKLTLAVEPTYEIAQTVYENLSFDAALENFNSVFSSAYSVSLFTDWRGPHFTQVWRKSRESDAPETFFGATKANRPLHPIAGVSAENCTEQLSVPGPWHERLPHFRLEFTPSHGAELQTEYLVPLRNAVDALRSVLALGEKIAPLLLVSEIRSVQADELWLSPFYKSPGIGIHFTFKPDWPSVRELLPEIEAALAPFEAKPHWGKLSTVFPDRLRDALSPLNRLWKTRGAARPEPEVSERVHRKSSLIVTKEPQAACILSRGYVHVLLQRKSVFSMRIVLPALCGLVLLTTCFSSPAFAQAPPDIDPTTVVMKATNPDAAQKKKLEALATATQKKGGAALEAVGPMIEKKIEALATSEAFLAKAGEIEKLPEAEQKEAGEKLKNDLINQIRPDLEKTMFTKMRSIMAEYFTGAAKVMKPAQKPKLEKARIAYFKKFDKEIPVAIKAMIESSMKGE